MTTPVGSIRLDLKIDGSDLPDEVLREIQGALAPVLADLQRRLAAVERDYKDLTKAAVKASGQQAVANEAVAQAVDSISDELQQAEREYAETARAAEKSAAKQAASGKLTARQINAVTRAVEKQTAAWEANAAARAAAAAAPTGEAPPPGRGNSGGGGGGRGGGGGGRRGGVGGFLTSPLGLNAIALGAGALPAATTAVVNLVGAVQQLGQAGALLPGVVGGIVSSVGTLKLGLLGVSDGFEAVWKAAKSGDPKDILKAAAALKDLAPSAQSAIKAAGDLRDEFDHLQRDIVQQNIFDGLDTSIKDLADKSMPTLTKGLGGISKAWNGTFKELGRVAGLDSTQSFLDKVFGNTADAQNRANKAINPLIHGLGTLTSESSDFLPRLADGLTALTTRFDNFITKSVANGDLDKWINEGIDAAKNFGESFLNIAKIITDLTKAAGGDGGFLKWLNDATTKLHAFLSSADGQASLKKFFDEGRESLREWGSILKDLGPVLKSLFDGLQNWSAVLMPILKAITWALSSMPGLVTGVVTAFLAWKSITGVVSLATSITGIGGGLDALPGKAGKAATGIKGAFAKLGGARGIFGTSLLTGGISAESSADTGLGQLFGAASTIGGGALLGSAFGPLGTIVGAGAGAAIAGVTFILAENAREAKAAAEAQDAFRAAIARTEAAVTLAQSAMKELNDSLLESGGKVDGSVISSTQNRLAQLPDLLSGKVDEDTVKGVVDAIHDLGLSEQQLATIVANGGPALDAVVTNLQKLGPDGYLAAQQIQQVAASIAGVQQVAQGANPILQQLAQSMNLSSLGDVAAQVRQIFQALPQGTPLTLDTQGVQGALDILRNVGAEISEINGKPVIINAEDQRVKDAITQLDALGIEITTLPTGEIVVQLDQQALRTAQGQMQSFLDQYKTLLVQPTVAPGTPGLSQGPGYNPLLPAGPPNADGGVLPGYSPGVDNMLVPMSGGEGVVIPEAMRALGSRWLYNVNSRFRRGLSPRGYADGGVVGGVPGVDDSSELGVLRQIRDLLAGKGGASAPLNQTASALSNITGTGQKTGPFGTPIKERNPGYEAAAAAIQALGGDPEKWIGADPTTYAPGLPGAPAATVNSSRYASVLAAFAQTGSLGSDLAGLGLDANDPVVRAITTARNKKNGLGADTIAALVEQVVGGGSYTGTLDSSNSTLIAALQTYRDKLGKPLRGARGSAPVAGPLGVPLTGLPGGYDAALLAQVPAGRYSQSGDADLTKGLADCSSAVEDLVNLMDGQPTGGRSLSTGNAAEWLAARGFVPGVGGPGDFRVGFNSEHLQATLPGGTPFNWGSDAAAANRGIGGTGADDPAFAQHYYRPAGAVPGAGGLAAGAGGGTPVFVTNWPGGGGGAGGLLGGLLNGATQGGGQAATNVLGDVMGGVAGLGQEPWNKRNATYAELNKLVTERNPLALAKLAGFNVEDFTRQGGDGGETMSNDAKFDASGRVFSDTSSILDRTFTSLNAQLDAMRKQMVDVIEQVSQKLNDEALEPVVKQGVQSALEGLKDSVSQSIGTAMGQAAAPPIADAVRSAIPSESGGGEIANTVAGAIPGLAPKAAGGPIWGGVPGKDSVPILAMPGEHVLTTGDVAAMGGQAGVYAFRRALHGAPGFATGGGVNVNDVVGAEFFGVSQIPILGALVNVLVRVLLAVLGVQVEARDTLTEITGEFRQFRGDFKAFDASGRLFADNSALSERSSTSEEEAAQERIRILKIVLQALIKYIIEKVIVPIGKAVANAAISAAGSAAGAAVNTQAPGAGGIVSALISSGGSAGVDIIADIGSEIGVQLGNVLLEVLAQGLQSYFPDLVSTVFGGGAIENLLAGPLNALLEGPLSLLGMLTGALTGLLSPLATVLGGGASFFDDGGVAHGVGVMQKATIRPERVLSPNQTVAFERLPDKLDRLINALNGKTAGDGGRTVYAEIKVDGGPEAGARVRDSLLELIS